MTMPRYRGKRDDNEGPLITLARQLGAEFEKVGPLDWWAGWRGKWYPLEIKNIDGKNEYTDKQVRFLIRCKEKQLPVWVWRSSRDVFESLNARQTA